MDGLTGSIILNWGQSDLPETILQDMQDDIVATIYGQGGWHRYYIKGNGGVGFSRGHAMDEGIQSAQKAGFSLF